MIGRAPSVAAATLALALASASVLPSPAIAVARAGPDPTAASTACPAADERLVLSTSTELDPACTYGGIDIVASGVVLDCRGALVRGIGRGGVGILVRTPADVALTDVTVRGCRVEGFTNSVRVTRDGFRTLPVGGELRHPTERIVIEGNELRRSRGAGAFVDGYVTDVALRGNRIEGAGSSGIYLETGSRRNVVEDNDIVANGFVESGPSGQPFSLGGLDLWFWGIGREGISIDGSRENVVRGNRISGNSAGGIFLYKNCGEFPDSGRYFERRDPAADNVIVANVIADEDVGVWIGSRMAENTLPMACTDPAYLEEPGRRVVLDRAPRTTVRANRFVDVRWGVRVEDDEATIEANRFEAPAPDRHGVVIGTPVRTEVLGRPVTGTVLRGNVSDIVGNADPYRWIHGQAGTLEEGNLALGRPARLCEGPPIERARFIFVLAAVALPVGGTPPPAPELRRPTWGILAPCERTPDPTAPADPPDREGDAAERPTDATSATPVAAIPTYAG